MMPVGISQSGNAAEAPKRRGGRPSAEQAGDVDRRILEAATDLFLTLGFDATSCDQVAIQAGAGKASIYARYANKEALFAAVVRHNVDRSVISPVDIPWHQPLHERLRMVGHSLLSHAIRSEVIAVMRIVATMVNRMPELAQSAERIGLGDGLSSVVAAITGEDEQPQEARDRAMKVATKFIDLALVPHQMRAMMGDDVAMLEAAASRQIDEAIGILSDAGWLADWT